jgi:uncharacterized membrane protein YhaH (DUF805 family)
MDFQQAVKTCLKKYVEFNGRAGRPEFWWFMLATILLQLVVSWVLGDIVALLVNLGLLLPSLAAGARRLHDMGKSGWFQLLGFIPVIGWAVLIYWLAQPSVGPNEYGEGPALPADVALPPPGAA